LVSRYLPHVAEKISMRLLARERITTLRPAVDLYVRQSCTVVHVRSCAQHLAFMTAM
jgi:hypothetical protein